MKRRHLAILIIVICLAMAPCLSAVPGDTDIESQYISKGQDDGSGSRGLGAEVAIVLVALAIVVAAVYLLLRLLRKLHPSLAPSSQKVDPIKPLARFHLAPKQTLHLVRCGSRLLLLGATSASINHVATIDDATEIDRILQAVGSGQSPLAHLSRFLHRGSQEQDHIKQEMNEDPQAAKDGK